MNNKLQVFVSSTYLDLKDERQAAVASILKSGNLPAGMELFTAGDKSQWEVIQRWISDCDIYMLILGGRYGSIEPVTGLSYTELEYDFAVLSGKPYFAVVINNDALELKVKDLGISVIETDNPQKLKEFKEKVLSKMSSFFSDTKDIKISVLENIPQLELENELKGWVRSDNITDTSALTEEITRLHGENKELREKLIQSQKKNTQPSKSNNKELFELIEILSIDMVDISGVKSVFNNGENSLDKVSLMDLAYSCKEKLTLGIENRIGMSTLSSFLFFTISPKLQIHELMLNEKVSGAKYRRYSATKKGLKLFSLYDKIFLESKNDKSKSKPKKNK